MPPVILEMIEATEDNYIPFTEDRRPSSATSGEPALLCPETLVEMLQIVSNVRQSCMDAFRDHQVEADDRMQRHFLRTCLLIQKVLQHITLLLTIL